MTRKKVAYAMVMTQVKGMYFERLALYSDSLVNRKSEILQN